MKLYRIASTRHPIFSGEGARLCGGRWNPRGYPVIYCSDSLATCLLEILVHTGGAPPPVNLGWIEIDAPDELSMERVFPEELPGWDEPSALASQEFGRKWLDEARSCLLWIPSVAASGLAWNAVLNVQHPEFQRVTANSVQSLKLDSRLFPRSRSVD